MYRLFITKQNSVLLIVCLIFVGCSYTPYRYNFSLIEPQSKARQNGVVGQAMSFEDENVKFRFIPSPENISVRIENKSDREIILDRESAEFIDTTGESRSVYYGNNYVDEVINYLQYSRHAPKIKIAPNSEISGYIWINDWADANLLGEGPSTYPITSHNIYNRLEPLFPRHSFEGKGEELSGSTFSLIIPIDFDGHISKYMFTFMINDVIE